MVVRAETKANLPWVEKYRPSTLDDLVSHEDIIRTISKFVKDDQVPHLLFYGPPGTGKTSTILACARQLYTPSQFSSMVLELNASDDRGIGIVRGPIFTFASTRTIFKSGFKLIILDEADAMTSDAQNALRRIAIGARPLTPFNCVLLYFIMPTFLYFFKCIRKMVTKTWRNSEHTSLIRRFCYDDFTRQYNQTIGADFFIRRIILPGRHEITVKITDVGGLELRGPMLANYLFNTNLVVLVYDITSSISFDCLAMWIDNVRKFVEKLPVCAIIGNKFIEKYTENVRFCIICNYLSKLMPALQSRCTRFRFGPLSHDQIIPRLNFVIDEEKVNISDDGRNALLTLAKGDMRKVLNVLQSTWLAYKNVTEENVYQCVGHPLKSDIQTIFVWLLNEDFKGAYQKIKDFKVVKGLALTDIITEIHQFVYRTEFTFEAQVMLLEKLADIEHRLVIATSENQQLTALVAAFYQARIISPNLEQPGGGI